MEYYSKEWCELAKEKLNSDEKHLADAKNLTGTFCFRIYDCPDGTDRIAYWTFEKGRCLEVKLEARPAPDPEIRSLPFDKTKILARTTAPYKMMAAINRGEIGVLQVLTDPNYKIEGPKWKVMRYLKGLNSWNRVCMSIPVEYPKETEAR